MDKAFNLIFDVNEVMLAIQMGTNFDAKPGLLFSVGNNIQLICGNGISVKPLEFNFNDIIESINENQKELTFDITLKELHQHLSTSEAKKFTIYLRFSKNGKTSFNITWM